MTEDPDIYCALFVVGVSFLCMMTRLAVSRENRPSHGGPIEELSTHTLSVHPASLSISLVSHNRVPQPVLISTCSVVWLIQVTRIHVMEPPTRPIQPQHHRHVLTTAHVFRDLVPEKEEHVSDIHTG